MAAILGGIATLRVGNWPKFGYAAGVALLPLGCAAACAHKAR